MSKYIRLLLITLLLPNISNAGWFGASNFEECILESMKGVTSDSAALAIRQACKNKFPTKGTSDSEVPAGVTSQLDGRAGMTDYGYFKGNIYNGNKEWTITQVTIALTPKTKVISLDPYKHPDPSIQTKKYNVVVTIPPLTNSDFNVSVSGESNSGFDWSITNARGHQK